MNHSDGHDLVDHHHNKISRRVRFFIDPSKTDEEILAAILDIAETGKDIEITPASGR